MTVQRFPGPDHPPSRPESAVATTSGGPAAAGRQVARHAWAAARGYQASGSSPSRATAAHVAPHGVDEDGLLGVLVLQGAILDRWGTHWDNKLE